VLGAARQLEPQRVHALLEVGVGQRRGRANHCAGDRLELVAPERPRRAVDAADNAGAGVGDERLQAGKRLGHGAVAINRLGDVVGHGAFGIRHLAFEQVEDALAAPVLGKIGTG
jgi:hypothetical protein